MLACATLGWGHIQIIGSLIVVRVAVGLQYVGAVVTRLRAMKWRRRHRKTEDAPLPFPACTHPLLLLFLTLLSPYATARTRSRRTEKGRKGRPLHWQIGQILPRRRHRPAEALACQEAQSTQNPIVLHPRNGVHSTVRSIPRQARRLSQVVGERIVARYRTVQNQRRAVAQGEPGVCHRNVDET